MSYTERITIYLQPLVQVSPRIIIVAVAVPVSPPDQHSPKLGHLASSQTVWSFNSLSFFLICVYFSPPGIDSFIHLGLGKGFFFVPTSTEYSSSDWRRMKSFKVGDSAARRWRSSVRVCGCWIWEEKDRTEIEERRFELIRVRDRDLNRECIFETTFVAQKRSSLEATLKMAILLPGGGWSCHACDAREWVAWLFWPWKIGYRIRVLNSLHRSLPETRL